jgi:hypothetical protein
MRQPLEFSIELSAQELLAPPALEGFVEIEDICCVDTQEVAALAASTTPAPAVCCDDDSVEIELTADEMDALLSEDWKP